MSSRFIEPPPDNSLQTFLSIKQAADKNWRRIKIEENVMGYEFPRALKNYYLTMNGLDTPGINIHGNSGYRYSAASIG
jgi:hypothetical protein